MPLFFPRSRAGVAVGPLEERCATGLFSRTLAVCCSTLASSSAEEFLRTGGGAIVPCADMPGAGRTRTVGSFIFWASAIPPETKTTATTAVNLIKVSIPLKLYSKEHVRFHSYKWRNLAGNLDKWHDLCKSLGEAEKAFVQNYLC